MHTGTRMASEQEAGEQHAHIAKFVVLKPKMLNFVVLMISKKETSLDFLF